jgi:hypothetical protein
MERILNRGDLEIGKLPDHFCRATELHSTRSLKFAEYTKLATRRVGPAVARQLGLLVH